MKQQNNCDGRPFRSVPILADKHYAVEMEAAALYALAEAKSYPIVCFAHVTNRMGLIENDFEKGAADGNTAFARLIATIAQAWRARP